MNKQPANQWVFRGRIATWLLLYNADLARCMLRFCGWFEWLVLPLRLEHCSVQKVHHLSPLPLESTAQSPSWQALPSFTRTSVLSNWQCSHYWPASPFSGCLARTRWRCTIATFYGPLDSSTGGFQPRSPLIGLILNQPGPFQRVCSWCRINLLVNWCWTLYQQRGGSIIACERGLGRKEEARRSYLPHLTHAQQISCWCMPALQLYSAGKKKRKKKRFSGQLLVIFSTVRQLITVITGVSFVCIIKALCEPHLNGLFLFLSNSKDASDGGKFRYLRKLWRSTSLPYRTHNRDIRFGFHHLVFV